MMRSPTRSLATRLGAGLAGSVALTAANAIGHHLNSESPRLDVLGMRAIVHALRAAGTRLPIGHTVPRAALAGDLLLNSLLFAVGVGRRGGRRGLLRGLGTGVALGVGAAALSPHFGLDDREGYHRGRRLAMVGLYALGGLASGIASRVHRGGAGGSSPS